MPLFMRRGSALGIGGVAGGRPTRCGRKGVPRAAASIAVSALVLAMGAGSAFASGTAGATPWTARSGTGPVPVVAVNAPRRGAPAPRGDSAHSEWASASSAGSASYSGWRKSGEDWYYYDSSGRMMTGWIVVGWDWYYLGPDGRMVTGWVYNKGYWYYLMPGTGQMVRNATLMYGSRAYRIDKDGRWVP